MELIRQLKALTERVDVIETREAPSVGSGAFTWTDVTPSSATLVAGSTASVVAAVQAMWEGTWYTIDEVAANPGFSVIFDFTGITRLPKCIVSRYKYTENSSHQVHVQLWNYTEATWNLIHSFAGTPGFLSIMKYIPDANAENYVSGGAARVRFIHDEMGNASHVIDIDYVALVSVLMPTI
jgi:hypothetical protein